MFAQDSQVKGGKNSAVGMAATRHLMSHEMIPSTDLVLTRRSHPAHEETSGSIFSLPTQGTQAMTSGGAPSTPDGNARRPNIRVKFWMTRPARSCFFGAVEATCSGTTHQVLMHHSKPFFHSKWRNPTLLGNISYFKHLLQHPAARWNVFLCRETGEVITHFHTVD